MTFSTKIQTYDGPETSNGFSLQSCGLNWDTGKVYISDRTYLSKSDILTGVQEWFEPSGTFNATDILSSYPSFDEADNIYKSGTSGPSSGVARKYDGTTFALQYTHNYPDPNIGAIGDIVITPVGSNRLVVDTGGGNDVVGVLNRTMISDNSGYITFIPWPNSNARSAICAGPVGSDSIYLITSPLGHGGTELGTLHRIRSISSGSVTVTAFPSYAPGDFELAATSLEFRGMTLDQTDGNLLVYTMINLGKYYIVKLSSVDGSILWRRYVDTTGGGSPSHFGDYQAARGSILHQKLGVYTINRFTILDTSDGSIISTQTSGLAQFGSPGSQCYNDTLGCIIITTVWNALDADGPSPLNASAPPFIGWSALYIDEAVVPPPPPPEQNFTFSYFKDPTYHDWVIPDPLDTGEDFISFLDTWYNVQDDTALWMQAPWVITYLDNTQVNPSCVMTPRWEWTDAGNNHKSGPPTELYIIRPGSVSDRRNRVRGKGRALQLHFESTTSKPFNLLGWSVQFDKNGGV